MQPLIEFFAYLPYSNFIIGVCGYVMMDKFAELCDATAVAAQLGRLDFVSALMAMIGIVLVLGGIFSFFIFEMSRKNMLLQRQNE